ncbi:hypothetical protein [Flavobacterium sp.]|uniref:hypothetical protein n=1 Tax=Flavobacterium sp. TaxID=239 RepID=UPI0025C23114|nr:hypothetical protein [Flavobacterium sp.]
MKLKITLTLAFLLILLKVQAQTPSINETKKKVFENSLSYQKVYKKIIEDDLKIIEAEKKLLKEKVASKISEDDKTKISKTIAEKDKEIEILKNKLENPARDILYHEYDSLYTRIIKQKRDSIAGYKKVIADRGDKLTLKKLDSIAGLVKKKQGEEQQTIQEKNERLSALDKFDWVLPTWERANRRKFFEDMYNNKIEKLIFLNSFALNSNTDAASVQNEIVTDNLLAVRLTFGSVLSVSSGSKKDGETPEEKEEQDKYKAEQEALSRLVNGGGNFYLEAILPLASTNQSNGDQFTFYAYANLRGAMDLKDLNNNVDTSTGNGSAGLNIYMAVSSDNKKFNFFAQGNGNFTVGNRGFYQNLGLNYEKPFLNGKVITGVTILNKFRLSAIISAFGSDEKVRSNKVTVGIQILP